MSVPVKALLIGFEYQPTPTLQQLPGIAVDLYRAYRFCQKITSDITVITDLDRDVKTAFVLRAIVDGIVDAHITSFIEELIQKKQYRKLGVNDNIFQFQALIESLFTGDKGPSSPVRVIVYYTGHGMDQSIMLPSRILFGMSQWRDSIVERCVPTAEIMWITDCCYPSSLELPFKLASGRYRYQNSTYHPRQQIIAFSSSEEKSVSTRQGSIFSRALFNLLGRRTVYLPAIASQLSDRLTQDQKQTNCLQVIGIYASNPQLEFLWSWLIPRNVLVDFATNTVIVHLSPKASSSQDAISNKSY